MNVLADRLFALLLGWTRALFNSLWDLVTDPSAGVSGFIRRFWLPIILLILVFGTVMDFAVWLIRWRPYLIWRDWFRRRDARRRLAVTRDYMEDLDHSPLDLPEYQDAAAYGAYGQDEPIHFDFGPQAPQPADYADPGAFQAQWSPQTPPNAPAFTPMLPWEQYRQEEPPPIPGGQAPYAAPEWQAYGQDGMMEGLEPDAMTPGQEPAYPERRRRAGSRRSRQPGLFRSLKETLFDQEGALEPLDALPPPIPQEEAFHKPYYPQSYNYRHAPQSNEQPRDLPPE